MIRVGQRLYPGRSLPEGVAIEGGAGWLVLVCVEAPTAREVAAHGVDKDGPWWAVESTKP